jgi:hypothetical protein
MRDGEPLSIPTSESGNDKVYLISAHTLFSREVFSSLLVPGQDPKERDLGQGLKICQLLAFNPNDFRATSPFLIGVTLSTPWKIMLSHTDEIGLLRQIQCQ